MLYVRHKYFKENEESEQHSEKKMYEYLGTIQFNLIKTNIFSRYHLREITYQIIQLFYLNVLVFDTQKLIQCM